MSEKIELLNQASGYGVLVGVGALFALMILVSTKLLYKYLHEDSESTEMFMVANRSIGLGLTALAIYSSWTWPTELLWVCTMVYNYGVMVTFWFGAGLALQICLMSVIGIEAKKKIPSSHTSLEIVNLRYGKAVHLLYLFLCLVNNLLSCSEAILGAAGVISIICGDLHIVAASMLIPFGVLLYTTVGGLKATFLTDFVHSLIVLIVLCYINTALISSDEIGGLDGLYRLISEFDGRTVEGNFEGSFLTGKSQGAIFFGIILTIGNFGLTVMDSSYWQKAFSADIKASVPGYLLAAATIVANVWPLGCIAGVAAIALEHTPIFPTYPRAMTADEVGSGFVLPYILKGVLGKHALGALLLIVYLAVTSVVSAQLISVSSIVSFDIYKTYINRDAKNHEMIRVSHFGVIFFGLFAAAFSVMLHYVKVNMAWMGYFVTIIVCPGVVPLVLTITWKRQTKLAAFVAPIVGLVFGLIVWITTCKHYYDDITVTNLGMELPILFGSLTSVFLPAIVSVVLSLTVHPYEFDWSELKKAQIIVQSDQISGDIKPESSRDSKAEVVIEVQDEKSLNSEEAIAENNGEEPVVQKEFKKTRFYIIWAYSSFIFVLFLLWVVWPLPLYRDWIWSENYFKGYVTVGLIWVYLALFIIGIFPLWDGRHTLLLVAKGVYRDLTKRTSKGK